MRIYAGLINKLAPHQFIVFGSNTQGRHGKGAAKWALEHAGAVYGQASGVQGQSYAIVTKDLTKPEHPSVSPEFIIQQITDLYLFACLHDAAEFLVAYTLRRNLNGYLPREMAEMFRAAVLSDGIPENIVFERNFARLVQSKT